MPHQPEDGQMKDFFGGGNLSLIFVLFIFSVQNIY